MYKRYLSILLLSFVLLPLCAFSAYPELEGTWMVNWRGDYIWRVYSEQKPTEEGQRRLDKYNVLVDDPSLYCIPSGVGRLWDEPDTLWRLEQYDDRVEIHYEIFDLKRVINLNQKNHPIDFIPSTTDINGNYIENLGHSIGWYDGDTLVIETLGFTESYITTLGTNVFPQSQALRSIERISMVEDNISLEISYFDPILMTAPLNVSYIYIPSQYEFSVYGCIPKDGEH
mgnify:CR=1 FL=1|tara:strand:- start:1854 stop:2537 length:684 start_codon:yes stop_codon:yes gene_type:complete